MNINDLILRLYDIEAINFGEFTLKSGIQSPFYIDLRLIQSYPLLLKAISEGMWKKIENINFEVICGVPYTAIPFTTAISITHNIPMIMRRKEVKDYGTKKAIEGAFKSGQRCIIVEDLITSGSSIIETSEALKFEGLIIKDVVVIIDREQGGKQILEDRKINLHSLLSMEQIITTLLTNEVITPEQGLKITNFINQSQILSII